MEHPLLWLSSPLLASPGAPLRVSFAPPVLHPCLSWANLGLTAGMRIRGCYSLVALAQIQFCREMGQFLFISLFISVAFSCSQCTWLPVAAPGGSEAGKCYLGCEQLLFLNPNSDLTILVCFTVVHKGEIKMSDRIKLLSHPIPTQGCRRGRLQSGRELWGQAVAGPCLPSSPALGPALAPTWGSSAVLWPSCTCREVSCHLPGTWDVGMP